MNRWLQIGRLATISIENNIERNEEIITSPQRGIFLELTELRLHVARVAETRPPTIVAIVYVVNSYGGFGPM